MSKRIQVPVPGVDFLEDLVVQVWDAITHFRSRLGDSAYAEASFERDGKHYTVRITETKGESK